MDINSDAGGSNEVGIFLRNTADSSGDLSNVDMIVMLKAKFCLKLTKTKVSLNFHLCFCLLYI